MIGWKYVSAYNYLNAVGRAFKILSCPVGGILVRKAFPLTEEVDISVSAPFMTDNLLNLQIEILLDLHHTWLSALSIRKQF